MAIHAIASIEEEPQTTLRAWSVRRIDTATDHLVGFVMQVGEGRVSSAIASFDPATAKLKTKSGRTYWLQGKPDSSPDAEYVWNLWCRASAVASWRDVSGEYLEQIQRARSGGDSPSAES